MRKVAYVLAMIPDKAQATTTWLDGSAVAVHVIAGDVVFVVEEGSKLGDSKQVKIQVLIVDCTGNVVGVFDILVINKFKANCNFVLTLFCRCINDIDLNLIWGEFPDK